MIDERDRGSTFSLGQLVDADRLQPRWDRRTGHIVEMTTPPRPRDTTAPGQFEQAVLAHLVQNRRYLGVAQVFSVANLWVDGLVRLTDGRLVPVEIKSVMGWRTACQAGWQFTAFTQSAQARALGPMRDAVLIFNRFDADWCRPVGDLAEKGFRDFYGQPVAWADGIRLHLVRFHDGRLEWPPICAAQPHPRLRS
jgi:hypothetical protein